MHLILSQTREPRTSICVRHTLWLIGQIELQTFIELSLSELGKVCMTDENDASDVINFAI